MVSTISTACSSAANAIMMGAKLKNGFWTVSLLAEQILFQNLL
jgi:5-formaminoimidazole-4-carboxamide-1-beta-D-ribofuranosyl 5'-monophosphate synthetase